MSIYFIIHKVREKTVKMKEEFYFHLCSSSTSIIPRPFLYALIFYCQSGLHNFSQKVKGLKLDSTSKLEKNHFIFIVYNKIQQRIDEVLKLVLKRKNAYFDKVVIVCHDKMRIDSQLMQYCFNNLSENALSPFLS